MGGGLFGTPLYLNPKCLAFSALLLAVYWMPPWRNVSKPYDLAAARAISIGLAFTGYILMAWYDYIYDANDVLKPTFLGWLSGPFKPQHYEDAYARLPLKWQKIVRWVDIVALVLAISFVVSPFFLY